MQKYASVFADIRKNRRICGVFKKEACGPPRGIAAGRTARSTRRKGIADGKKKREEGRNEPIKIINGEGGAAAESAGARSFALTYAPVPW